MSNNKPEKKREVIKFNTYDRFKPILYADLFLPSWVNGYSIGVEYIYNWFLSKFPKNYFRTIHVSGKSSFDDFRRFSIGDLAKREKPACIFEAQIQYDYDDNNLDLNYFGIDEYIKRSKWQRSFFKDPRRGLYIGHDMEAMLINFNIRTRYDTRAEQLDAFNRMRKLFRIGCTETIDLDMDIHLPYDLMVKLAIAAGFPTSNEHDAILDPWGFTQYLNAHSQLPILYKMRYINSKYEFFVRMRNLPVHLNMTNSLDVDDGENDGQLMTNFNISMQVEMRLPVPKCFLFYNEGKIESSIEVEPNNNGINIYSMRVFDIPEVNYKGWVMYGHSNYLADDAYKTVDKINIRELFIAPPDSRIGTSLNDIIDDSLNNFISPDSFIDIQVYTNDLSINHGGKLATKMNWETREIILPENTINTYFYIAVYIDRLYVNSKIIDIDKANQSRLKESRKKYINHNYKEAYDLEPHIQIVKPYPTNFPKPNKKK